MLKKKIIAGAIIALALMVVSVASAATLPLKVGSKGADVMTVQAKVGVTADGSFGPMTKAAVMAWQKSNGLVADGVVGPKTWAAMMATTGGTTGGTTGATCPNGNLLANNCLPGTTTPSTLEGGAGDISASLISTDVETNLVEGSKDQKILGFKVTADGSDVKVSNIKVTLTKGATGSSYLDRYVSDVSVWMGDKKVATVDADEFSKDSSGVYSKSIALNGAIVKEGTSNKATFYVTLTGVSNIDTGDMSATWTVKADNFRYTDATGVILTYNPSTLESAALDVMDIAGAGDVKLAVSKASSNPVAGNVMVSDTGSTNVTMLTFKMKNTGADMTFDSLDFDLTGSVAAGNLDDMLSELTLKEGSATLGSTSTFSNSADTDTVTIDLDDTYTIDADSTVTFTVIAKIADIDNFSQGDSLKVSYVADSANLEVASTRTAFTSESGSATGETQTFYSEGVNASAFTPGSSTKNDNGSGVTTSVSWPLTFKLTAFGNEYYVRKDGLSASGASFSNLTASSGATENGNYWVISDGDTVTFSTTGAVTTGVAGTFKSITLSTLKFNTSATTSGESTYTFSPSSSYKTGEVLW